MKDKTAKLLPAILIVVLNIVDSVLTKIGLDKGLEESNPIMYFLFQTNGAGWLLKLFVNLAFVYYIAACEVSERFIRGMWFVVGFFFAAAIVNLSIIVAL